MTNSPALRAFLDNLYDEAFGVLVDLRDFVSSELVDEKIEIPDDARELAVHEVSRATRRMADVMAWLLLQKAIDAGEVAPDAAAAHSAGGIAPESLDPTDPSPEAMERLPVALRGLIDRSRRLHEKTVQLKTRGESQTSD